jgi:cytochrome P450
VFGVCDPRKAARRRKLYQQAGTKTAVRTWEPRVVELIDQTIEKIKRDAEQNGTADIFKWFSMMTTDVLAEIAFGDPLKMVENEVVMLLEHVTGD